MSAKSTVEALWEIREMAREAHSRQEASYDAILAALRELLAKDIGDVLRAKLEDLHQYIRLLHRTRNTFHETPLVSLLAHHLDAVEKAVCELPQGSA